jgi:MFS family permease
MKVNRTLIKIGIVCIALNDSATGATNSALASIAAAMPLVAPALIQMIATLPTLFQAFMPLIYGKSVDFMKKKTWLYIGGAAFIIGGVAPAFFNSSIYIILFFRAVLGIGVGILLPMATDLCIDFFEGKERSTMLGYVSAFTSLSGVVFSMLGGFFANIRWEYTFFAYLASVIFLGISFFLLPEPDRSVKLKADAEAKVNTKLTLGTYIHAVFFGFFFMLWMIAPTNTAMVLVVENIAGPAQIGTAFAIQTVFAFVFAVIFGRLFKAIRFALLPISYLLGAAGLYVCSIAQTFPLFVLGLSLLGVAIGLVNPATMSKLTHLVPYTAASKAISMGYCLFALGAFFQPILFNLITVPGRSPFFLGSIGMLIFAVLVLIGDRAFPTPVSSSSPQSDVISQ